MSSSPGTPDSNRKIADILYDHGDDLSRVREIDHWVYFPSAEARTDFLARCASLGLSVARTMEPDAHSKQFGAVVFHVDAPNIQLMDALTQQLIALAAETGGEYDGWETQILE
jgi:regulator of RNase E activity RraB